MEEQAPICQDRPPDSSKWIRRAQVYRSTFRFHAERIRNKSTLKRAARRCGIRNPLYIPLSEVRARLKVCKEKCNYFRKHGQKYRTCHLNFRLKIAQDKGDEQSEKRILAILQGEKYRAHWRRLNYGMRKSYGRSARVVSEKNDDGEIVEYEGQKTIEYAIWSNIHDERFYVAEHAPICQDRLRGEFGYQSDTPAARRVLDSTSNYTEDFDPPTKELID